MKTKFSNVVNIRNLPEYHPGQTDVQEIELFDIVALTYDLPEHNLWRGQVGTVVEILANGEAFEVEFSDRDGRTYESPRISRVSTYGPSSRTDAETFDKNYQ